MASLLEPPEPSSVDVTDTSEGEDHFSDASEGQQSDGQSIPSTRLERVDSSPSHGEVPGTSAHDLRKADAQPDVVAQAHKVPTETFTIQNHDVEDDGNENNEHETETETENNEQDDVNDAHLVGEDDFDDFEEGAEDEDFGTFDSADLVSDEQSQLNQVDITAEGSAPQHSLPLFEFNGLGSAEDIAAASQLYLRDLFPAANQTDDGQEGTELAPVNRSFLTERSQSLWLQLVAPPPLQPPNWIRSRIRRLFLVSLGVPVDLDEILPASKQKKLVLPSVEAEGDAVQPAAVATRSNGAVNKLKQDNASGASLASTPSKAERKKRGPAPPPSLDLNTARLKSAITEAALKNLTDDELKQHVTSLDDLKQRAGKVLEYWLIQRDSANGDKEAFEEVIENLVKHAKRIRK